MEVDVRTVEDVTLTGDRGQEITVAVGETADGDYEAAVVGVERPQPRNRMQLAISQAIRNPQSESSPDDAPIVKAPDQFTAVGMAVDAYQHEKHGCTCGPDEACSDCGEDFDTEPVEVEFDEE